MGGFQEARSAATQRRIAITKSMLSDMKSLKMMGLTGMANHVVQNERIKETKKLERLMWMAVWNNVVGKYLLMVGFPWSSGAVTYPSYC